MSRVRNHVVRNLLLFLFVLNVSDGLFSPLFAVFVTEQVIGGSLATVGFSFAIFSIVKSAVQLATAYRIDRTKAERDDYVALLVGSTIATVGMFLYLAVRTEAHLYALQVLNGVAVGVLMAPYYAIFSRHVDKGKEAVQWSLFSVGGLTVSAALGSAVGGVVAERYGFPVTLLSAGGLSAVATFLLVFLAPGVLNPHRHR